METEDRNERQVRPMEKPCLQAMGQVVIQNGRSVYQMTSPNQRSLTIGQPCAN